MLNIELCYISKGSRYCKGGVASVRDENIKNVMCLRSNVYVYIHAKCACAHV